MKANVPLARALRLVNPGPLVLVTARYKDRLNVMPAAWVVPLSKAPPLVGVAIHRSRFTHELVRRSQQFALNVPGRPLAEAVVQLGSTSGRDVDDKLTSVGFTLAEPQQTNAPLIEQCLAWLECAVVNEVEVGDHTLFVGEVLAARAEQEAFDETWRLTDEETNPLHHLGSDVFATLSEPFHVT